MGWWLDGRDFVLEYFELFEKFDILLVLVNKERFLYLKFFGPVGILLLQILDLGLELVDLGIALIEFSCFRIQLLLDIL